MKSFATLFNLNYLNRGLSLLDSLRNQQIDFQLFIICLDNKTFDYLKNNPNPEVTPILLSNLEKYCPQLLTAKGNRTMVEYIFTLSPVIPLYILDTYDDIDIITTLDADIFFFSDPAPIFDELKDYSVLITPHRFRSELREREIYGLFNVSFQCFRRDPIAREILETWRDQCLAWCYDRLDDDKFADQKYLDRWPILSDKVKVLAHKGAGVAPWNLMNYSLTVKDNQVSVGNANLIFYHFHALKEIRKGLFTHALDDFLGYSSRLVTNKIYKPYIVSLSKYTLPEINRVVSDRSREIPVPVLIKKFLKGGMYLFSKKNSNLFCANWRVYKYFLQLKNSKKIDLV